MSYLPVVRSAPKFFALLIAVTFLRIDHSFAQYRFLENGRQLVPSSDAGFLLDTPARWKLDLSGVWDFSITNGPTGSVRVPSAYDFEGEVEFRRKFELTSDQLENHLFHFVMYGSNYNTSVTINGDFLTNHVGGYTTFVQTIPSEFLQLGTENSINVLVSNRLDARNTIPIRSHVWGWRNYGGILRDVFILATPRFYINDVVVDSELSGNFTSATVTVQATMEGTLPQQTPVPGKQTTFGFSFELVDKISGVSVAKSAIMPLKPDGHQWVNAPASIKIQEPKIWSPDSPDLYLVKCYIVRVVGREQTIIDEYDVNYGIRRLEIIDGNIRLNGKRFVAKGVLWNEEHPSWGSALTEEEMEKDVILMKQLGANLVRFGNHPPHPYMLNLCNRYGLMAMEELPVVGVPADILADEFYIELAVGRMKEMILRDRNHPSVLAWGIGDEFESSSLRARVFVDSLVRIAKRLDTRPTYFGSRMPDNDKCTGLVDIAALNLHVRDIKRFKSTLESWKQKHPMQPVFLSKFGTEVQDGNQNGYSDPLSYEAQARFYIQRFDALKSLDYDGAIIWALNDWKGDRPALRVNSGNPWMHTRGLVSYLREKRLAYEAVRTIFNGQKFVALPSGNYSHSAPIVYVLSGLVMLIGSAYLYNASRRFRESLNRSLMNSYNFFADIRDQRIVPVFLSTLLGLMVSAATAIVLSSIFYHFKDSWVLDNLLSYLLVYDDIKETIVRLIWEPWKFIVYCSLFLFAILLLTATCVLFISPLFKARIYPFHAYSVTMWSSSPLLTLVPVGMIVYRVMESSVYVIPAVALFVVLNLWVGLRLMKGVAIVFDAFPAKVYALGTLSMIGVLALVYFYLDYTQSASIYLTFMYNVATGSQ
ncbi:MAG: hypothetical protein HY708_04655 [Ignavibacteriae bacterium]|nr:hypothetical protein [Ignavibacteriota bacterium]